MANKSPKRINAYRIVVHVTAKEHEAVTKDARALGLKNAHRWGAMKLATDIAQALARK